MEDGDDDVSVDSKIVRDDGGGDCLVYEYDGGDYLKDC